jgi:hypothetical protein
MMREEPDPAVLYPEVAERGSLAAALQAVAADQGLSLNMIASERDLLRHATAPSVLSHREKLFVTAWHFERRWSVSGSANNGILVSGDTDNLNHIPVVVHAWAEGAPLSEIEQAASFDLLNGRFEVPDGNHADIITSEWQLVLKEARHTNWPKYQALIEATYAEPKLRKLYPFTSHWALGFATIPYVRASSFGILVAFTERGDYIITDWDTAGPVGRHTEVARVSTPAEAISIVIDRLSEGLDPDDQSAQAPETD